MIRHYLGAAIRFNQARPLDELFVEAVVELLQVLFEERRVGVVELAEGVRQPSGDDFSVEGV